MKELSIEQKAESYDKALKVIKDNLDALNEIAETGAETVNIQAIKNCFYRAFPVLKEGYIDKNSQEHQESNDEAVFNGHESFRELAAIGAMQGIMNFFGSLDYNRETIAKLAVEQADALIKELKKE